MRKGIKPWRGSWQDRCRVRGHQWRSRGHATGRAGGCGGEDVGEGEAGVGIGEEGSDDAGRIGGAEGEEALVFEEVGEAGEGGFEGVAGGEVGGGTGFGEAGSGEVEDDEAEEGDLFVEAGDLGGARVVVEVLGLEFAGVEAVLEGVGVVGLATGVAGFGGGGHGRWEHRELSANYANGREWFFVGVGSRVTLHVSGFIFHLPMVGLHAAGCTLQVSRVKEKDWRWAPVQGGL